MALPPPPPPSAKYDVQTLGGLWAILVASAVAAILIAQPTLAFMNDVLSRAYRRGRECCGLPPEPWKPETGMTQLGVIRELFRPAPPPSSERHSSILEYLACIKALLESQVENIQEQRTATATASKGCEAAQAEQPTLQPAACEGNAPDPIVNVRARIVVRDKTAQAEQPTLQPTAPCESNAPDPIVDVRARIVARNSHHDTRSEVDPNEDLRI